MAKKHNKHSHNHNHNHSHNHHEPQRAEPTPDADDEDGTIFDAAAYPELAHLDLGQLSADLGDEFEIVSADDELDPLDVDDEVTLLLPTLSLEEVLQQLLTAAELPPERELFVFSDLSRQDMEIVRASWEMIALERRREVAGLLVMTAQDNLDWVLGRFWRILLDDPDATVREHAVRGLWDDDELDLIGPLVQILRGDPATGVRAAAATALGAYVLAGELEELDAALAMRAEEALLAVLHNDQEPLAVRRRALESVAYSGETGIRQLIEDAYYAPDEEMRISSLFAMGRSADVRWRPLARAELRNPSTAVRAEAAVACGELEAKAALEDLLALLSDRHESVRLAAIFALGRIGGTDARDALEAMYLSNNPVEVEAAQDALEEMQFYAETAVALFDDALEDDDELDTDPVDDWYDLEDRELGDYDDDDDDADDADAGEDDDDFDDDEK